MTFRGRDIYKSPAPKSGISYGNPEYEWREAARFAHLPYHVFRRLAIEEQEAVIAHYRTSGRIEAVIAHANRPKKKPKGATPRRGRRR